MVMTTHGRSGVERWFVGDVANRILRLSSKPILLVSSDR